MSAYLDSCIVIYLVEKQEPWRTRIQSKLLPRTGPLPVIRYSDLTRMECRVGPKLKSDSTALSEYDAFFATPRFQRVSMDTAVFELATDLRAQYRLKTPDALHLAAAISTGCDEFWTNDLRLEQAAEGHLRVVVMNELP